MGSGGAQQLQLTSGSRGARFESRLTLFKIFLLSALSYQQ